MSLASILSRFTRSSANIFHNRVSVLNGNSINIHRRCASNLSNTMRFAQFQRKNDDRISFGVLSEDGSSIVDLSGTGNVPNDMIRFIQSNIDWIELDDVLRNKPSEPVTSAIKFVSPVTNPEKIVCIGLNYLGHCQEQNKEPPKEPMFFSKFASALTGPTGNVILHSITNVSKRTLQREFDVFISRVYFRCSNLIGKSNWP